MSAVAAAIGVTAVVGGIVASNNARTAAAEQDHANSLAIQNQQNMLASQQASAAPYLASGNKSLASLNSQMPDLTRQFTMQDFQSSPGYQFQLQQGQQSLQRSAASKGLLNSVGTQQNLDNYSQGLANQDYQQALGNFTNSQQQRYNMLSGLSQQGLQATGMTNAAAQNAGNNISNNMIGQGNASAAGIIGSGNAVNGSLSSGMNGYVNYSMMNQLMNNPNASQRFNYNSSNPGMGMSMLQPNQGAGYQMPAYQDSSGMMKEIA